MAAAALLLTATACGERSEPIGPSAELYPVTVTVGERPLVLERPARRIAVVSPDATQLLTALGAGDRIVGTPFAPNGEIRLEELTKLRPDLVLATASLDQRRLARAAAAARAPVYVAPDDSIRGIERTITQLGLLTEKPVEARRLVRALEEQRERIRRRVADEPRVSVFVDTGFFTTVSNQSLVGDLVREARGLNIAGDAADAGPFDLRELIRRNPRVYLATSDSGTTLADLRKNRHTRRLTAIRRGRYETVDAALLVPGPRIGQGLAAVARALHPDAFR